MDEKLSIRRFLKPNQYLQTIYSQLKRNSIIPFQNQKPKINDEILEIKQFDDNQDIRQAREKDQYITLYKEKIIKDRKYLNNKHSNRQYIQNLIVNRHGHSLHLDTDNSQFFKSQSVDQLLSQDVPNHKNIFLNQNLTPLRLKKTNSKIFTETDQQISVHSPNTSNTPLKKSKFFDDFQSDQQKELENSPQKQFKYLNFQNQFESGKFNGSQNDQGFLIDFNNSQPQTERNSTVYISKQNLNSTQTKQTGILRRKNNFSLQSKNNMTSSTDSIDVIRKQSIATEQDNPPQRRKSILKTARLSRLIDQNFFIDKLTLDEFRFQVVVTKNDMMDIISKIQNKKFQLNKRESVLTDKTELDQLLKKQLKAMVTSIMNVLNRYVLESQQYDFLLNRLEQFQYLHHLFFDLQRQEILLLEDFDLLYNRILHPTFMKFFQNFEYYEIIQCFLVPELEFITQEFQKFLFQKENLKIKEIQDRVLLLQSNIYNIQNEFVNKKQKPSVLLEYYQQMTPDFSFQLFNQMRSLDKLSQNLNKGTEQFNGVGIEKFSQTVLNISNRINNYTETVSKQFPQFEVESILRNSKGYNVKTVQDFIEQHQQLKELQNKY